MTEPTPPTELGRLRILSSTAGIRVSPLQLGAMSIGDAWAGLMGSMNKPSAFKLLDTFYESGGNIIDAASNYQNEQSEKWIGEWIQARQNRDSLVLATKFSMDYRSHEVGRGPQAANFAGNSRRSIHVGIRDSLRKLQTDYVDIYYIHYWDYTTSIKEIMDALHILVEQGKVLYLGASDTPAWVVAAANTYAIAHGKTPFSIYQGRWNVLNRDFERDIIPMARHFGMALAPWDVLGGGKFQTKAELERRESTGETLRNFGGRPPYQLEDEVKMSEALAKVASEHNIESVTAIALAYVMSKAGNVFPVVGGRRIEHLRDNIQALSIKLTDEQIGYLESVKPFNIGFPHNFVPPDPNVSGQSFLIARTNAIKFPNARKLTSL
ncbi:putative aryl-alcohol dehydrogenase [Aspergillus sclerotioniger CBS 115572]|uniref:Aldo-keto reductase ausK n=1 Tax=Aspergillus sclerotioniger CBS 115572 TaxID=1450535 RepID=A0A317WJG2_9EURO|nr:putative aryl-alcohol dehydrogenase [Aspergillus sclerotioniger CBS 115572]PWY86594.1 putative aryl-alcohol dehydrogenase [Aspergillus sclerotioniger CBS 115572]